MDPQANDIQSPTTVEESTIVIYARVGIYIFLLLVFTNAFVRCIQKRRRRRCNNPASIVTQTAVPSSEAEPRHRGFPTVRYYSYNPLAFVTVAVVEESCMICLEALDVGGDQVGQLQYCGHVFHRDCITRWLNTSSLCPACRSFAINRRRSMLISCIKIIGASLGIAYILSLFITYVGLHNLHLVTTFNDTSALFS